ncbi:T6SS effector BTH_I2691 family protein (plasmid) [Rahnella variigena]|uniref:T6SS effector BTH_I2691 family protein n=1 Tax=Rahnella variigena TaxID=574964 RepID=UPI00244AB3B7|nr:T6SS effector BTH_I2691 family protein [Rahnella variigena]MDH2899142.1 hypothetical protein [Rahnella variigena]
MSSQSQASQNSAASEQVAGTPAGCKACKREGVAIFPLRVAAVPKPLVNTGWAPSVPKQDSELTGGEYKYALRTLREGYLYVLLDNTYWQGYQVTPEGALRMFNAEEMPEGEKVESLSEACLTQNHEIVAGFINIDPKYTQAAVAFSSDPWSKTVLDEYQNGTRPASRFTQITLSEGNVTAADHSRSLTLDPSLSALKSNVLEFATDSFPSIAGKEGLPNGAHGFSHRMDPQKQTALGNRIAQLTHQYKAPVTALVLDDQVGVIQELNTGRLDCVEALAAYTAITSNIHKKMISDAILQIKQSTAAQMKTDPNIKGVYTPGYTTSYSTSRENQVAAEVYKATRRMEDYYDEPARAEFARDYQSTVDGYNRKIVATWKDLNAAYRSALWLAILKNDYAPQNSAISWVAQLTTITRCLQGSVAGFDMENSGKDSETPEWARWLEDPQSPPYMALMRSQPGVTDLPSQVFGGSLTYANLKAVLNSKEVSDYINSPAYQKIMASLITSISGAFSKLENTLSAQAKSGMVRMLQAVAYTSADVPAATLLTGKLTIREYQHMLQIQLDAHGKPAWSISGQENGRVTSTSRMGHWTQITDPAILDQKITVKLGAPLNKALPAAVTSDAIDRSLLSGEIELGEADMRNAVRSQLKVSTDLQSGFIGVILAGILLYATFSDLDELKKAIPGDTQAEMGLASKSLIIMASAVEIVGQSAAVAGLFKNGDLLIRGAGVIGGFAAIIDGIALGIKAYDLMQAGDSTAALLYGIAAGLTIISGGAAVWFSYAGIFTIFGPIGWCIALGIAAVTLVAIGNLFVRSPLERWLSHTCFGTDQNEDDKHPMWRIENPEDLQEAMKQLHILASGVSAQLSGDWATEMMSNTRILGNRMLAARVMLTDCNPAGSDWIVELTATGCSGNRLLLARSASPAKLVGLTPPEQQTYQKMPILIGSRMGVVPGALPVTEVKSANSMSETWGVISSETHCGLQLDGEFPLNTARFNNAELVVTYWPDKTQQDDSLQLTTQLDS